jgi:predicted ATPase/signal transduction histidine kinase
MLNGIPGVIALLGLEEYESTPVLVLEDIGADSLDIIMSDSGLNLEESLTIAIQTAEILGRIHKADITHKDINPSNIIYNRHRDELKIIDFGIASVLSVENPAFSGPAAMEGTPAYISPEQTGRINRSVDYRTDYYSLGATLFKLVTGELPFDAQDPLAVLHKHFATTPPDPRERAPSLPVSVALVIRKLLSKNAEDRYQSAAGIVSDLRECLMHVREGTDDPDFRTGCEDIPERLRAPETLYGRDRDIQALLSEFEEIRHGGTRLTWVTGDPGIGKTSLVRELCAPIELKGGIFITGKCDQYKRSLPYQAISDALRELVRQLLTESDDKLEEWRRKLLSAIGPNGKLITDVVPEIETVIGAQPALPELGPDESRNLFHHVFLSFLGVLASPDHPLVIFLDDLQWADSSSLSLLRRVLEDRRSSCLYIIGSYRNTETDKSDPPGMAPDSVKPDRTPGTHIQLRPLTSDEVFLMIGDTLFRRDEDARLLAELVHEKTGGNPFFIKEFIKALADDGLIRFDLRRGEWQWDEHEIRLRSVTDNVVALMSARLARYGSETGEVLQHAAALGNRFDLEALTLACRLAEKEIIRRLREPLKEGLILPLGQGWKSVQHGTFTAVDRSGIEFRFAHDRVQQAAYALIPQHEIERMHLRIGLCLLEGIPRANRSKRIFDIVSHLNAAGIIPHHVLSGEGAAELNLEAGLKAKAGTAYDASAHYFAAGMSFLGEGAWQTHYDLMLELMMHAAETEYLRTDFDAMERLADQVVRHAVTVVDSARVRKIQIQALVARNENRKAIRLGLSVLREMGLRFPDRPTRLGLAFSYLGFRAALMRRDADDLAALPPMSDETTRAATTILAGVASAAYVTVPNLVPLIAFRLVRLSLKKGIAPATAYACTGCGLILCGVMNRIPEGHRFGRVALRLLDRPTGDDLKAKTLFAVNCFTRHWKEPLTDTLPPLKDSYRMGLQTGDIECAAVSAFMHSRYAYFAGKELDVLEQEMAEHGSAIDRLKYESPLHAHRMTHQAVHNLMGRSETLTDLAGEIYDEHEWLPLHIRQDDARAMLLYHFNKTVLAYLFGRYDQALYHADLGEAFIHKGRGTFTVCVLNLYQTLSCLAACSEATGKERNRLMRSARRNLKQMNRWAAHAPMNFRHKYLMMEGERLRVLGKADAAIDCFGKAAELAKKHGFMQEEALAKELAGRLLIDEGRGHSAASYLMEARYTYERWGASAKVRHLARTFSSHLPVRAVSGDPTDQDLTTLSHSLPITITASGERLDLASVVKASQILSGEIMLGKFQGELLKVVMENAGAERGALILVSEGRPVIEALGSVDPLHIDVMCSAPIREDCEVPASVVNYVLRSGETVVLDDASENGDFKNDAYIRRTGARSILCIPLARQARTNAIVYLENNLVTGAFTPDRVKVLTLLGSQAAISLENARLYQDLERRVAERTEQLRSTNAELRSEIARKEVAQRSLLEAKMAAETASRAKTDFLAAMSHELRTPLNAIIGFSELLAEEAYGPLNESQKLYMRQVLDAGDHLLTLINNVLDMAKVESGKMAPQLAPVRLDDLISDSLLIVKDRAQIRGITVETAIDDELADASVQADPVKLRQVMFNLLSNAAKFTPEGGTITVKVEKNSEELTISVSDTGIGIEPHDRERIFDPFEQLDPQNAMGQGTGLGLALTRRLVELHRGRIWVESSGKGSGSTFIFTLPWDRRPAHDS